MGKELVARAKHLNLTFHETHGRILELTPTIVF